VRLTAQKSDVQGLLAWSRPIQMESQSNCFLTLFSHPLAILTRRVQPHLCLADLGVGPHVASACVRQLDRRLRPAWTYRSLMAVACSGLQRFKSTK
jgi:hypothetical protein